MFFIFVFVKKILNIQFIKDINMKSKIIIYTANKIQNI